MPVDFSEKAVFVTGGASGIGRAAAHAFARAGARVFLADRDEQRARHVAGEIEDEGGAARAAPVNVRDASSVADAVQQAVEAYGTLDAACNAAGIESPQVPAAELEEADWDRVLDADLKSVWLSMKHELRQMVEQEHGGAIVNVASAFGTVGHPRRPAYAAAKHGVIGLTKAAALDYAEQGVRINAVCPSHVYTALQRRAQHDLTLPERYDVMQTYPMRRFGDPEEVAEAILWLASDAASYVTGTSLAVDGGYTAR